jgi:hypothetical protein
MREREQPARPRAPEPKAKGSRSPNPLILLAALLLGACGFNPVEGDFGVVEVVPEERDCWVTVRELDSTGRVYTEKRRCDGAGHDVKFFGWRWE